MGRYILYTHTSAYPTATPAKGHMHIPRTHCATVAARAGKHAVATTVAQTCKHSAPSVPSHHSHTAEAARLSRGLGHISSAHASEIRMHADRRLAVTRPENHSSLKAKHALATAVARAGTMLLASPYCRRACHSVSHGVGQSSRNLLSPPPVSWRRPPSEPLLRF